MKSLIQKLNILKESTKPNQEWLALERAKLLEQLKVFSYSKPGQTFTPPPFFKGLGFRFANFILTLKPMAVSGLILVLFFSGLGLVLASRDSLPGGLLYPVKISLERAKMQLTLAQDKKTELQMEITTQRLEELVKLREKSELIEGQEKKVKEGVKNFQREISLLKDNLNKLEEKVSPEKVAAVTEVVDSRSQEYKEILQESSQNLFPFVQEDLSEALDSVQELSLVVSKIKESQELKEKDKKEVVERKKRSNEVPLEERVSQAIIQEEKEKSSSVIGERSPIFLSKGGEGAIESQAVRDDKKEVEPQVIGGEEESSGEVSIPLESKEGTVWIDLRYEK